MDQLEDAVGIVDRKGMLLFANKAMREALPDDAAGRRLDDLLPDGHPYRKIIDDAIATRQPRGPLVAMLTQPTPGERLIVANPIETSDKRALDVILISRNLEYLSQVQSAVSYSRKLAERSRRSARQSAGVAHEVKNPLNATVIHLELLKEQLAASGAPPSAMDHVAIIAAQMRRLDEVVQEFLRFIRPEDLKLERVQPSALIDAIRPIVSAEAERHGIELRIEITNGLPDVRVDSGMMQQALLNLALNACQAMPRGGRLSLSASSASGKRVEIVCQDTGPGIKPEHLDKIFDLYFTTKEKGSGIGLSMVDRAVQLHDGEIDVESIPGADDIPRPVAPSLILGFIMGGVNKLAGVVALAVLAASASGCARLFARSIGPPLNMPSPPARVVPIESQPIVVAPPTVDDVPSRAPEPIEPPPPTPPVRVDRSEPVPPPRTEAPADAGVVAPSPAPTPPPALQTTANPTEAEQRTRAALESAKRDLGRIDLRRLSTDARAQYEIAKRFVQQAEDALRARNPLFAEQLADKAATLAALLQRQ